MERIDVIASFLEVEHNEIEQISETTFEYDNDIFHILNDEEVDDKIIDCRESLEIDILEEIKYFNKKGNLPYGTRLIINEDYLNEVNDEYIGEFINRIENYNIYRE